MKAFKEDHSHTRIAVLETITSQTSQTLSRLEKKIDDGFSENTQKQDRLEDKIENTRKENTSHFRTTIFTLLTLIGTPLLMESMKLLIKFFAK